ncbi:Dimethyladenosine transferase [gamma proteobacterium HdN1]|nr:Dimethyladenosine transferase [gamma proteobacterium HdN1]
MGRKQSFGHGHTVKKRFGQNFLHDPHVIDSIVAAVNPQKSDNLVEIGPGQGALTGALLPYLDQLQAIELDRDLIPYLLASFATTGKLHIHQADALRFDFGTLIHPDKKLRVVGNLPYNISTPLLFHLLDYASGIQDMHFMLQKEVVDRMAAGANEEAYGRLGIMIQYHCNVEALFDVPPEAFNPPPKVTSAIVRLTPRSAHVTPALDVKLLGTLVTEAFTQRRKTVRNALKNRLSPEDLEACGIDLKLRPENLTLNDYVSLANYLFQQAPRQTDTVDPP